MQDINGQHCAWQILNISEVDGNLANGGDSELFAGRYCWRRFWPGHGSVAMAVVFRSTFLRHLRRVEVLGRNIFVYANEFKVGAPAGAGTSEARGGAFNGYFLHGSHSNLESCISELVQLLRRRRRLLPTYVVGDFNIDLLPPSREDPYATRPGRMDHHRDRRVHLNNLCRAFTVKIMPIHSIHGTPGGPHKDICTRVLISRIPIGDQLGGPARLDFALSSAIAPCLCSYHWTTYLADHCLVALDITVIAVTKPKRPPSTWSCTCLSGFRKALSLMLPRSFASVESIHEE